MMRKWLLIFLVIAVFTLLGWMNKRSLEARYPLLKRISSTISIVSWVLLAAYCVTFLYWLFKEIIN